MIRPTLIRIVLLTMLGWIASTVPATTPPNLDTTLAAQEERVAGDPHDPVAWNDLGNLLVVVGRNAEAEQAYRRALELAPGDATPRFNLALLMQQDGRAKEAESELRQVLETHPRHAWAHYQLGVLLAARKLRGEALDHFARALAYDPSLSFAENNPHIIDNELFTEALLRSQRYGEPAAARVPRQYGDPERIVHLLLEQRQQPEGETETEDVEPAPEPGGAPPARDTGGPAPSFEDAPDAARPREDAAAPGAVRRQGTPPATTLIQVPESRRGTPPPPSTERRVVTPNEVPPTTGTVRRGQRTDASGRPVTPPTTRVPRQRQTTPPPPPRSSRYIPPSRRSSAQLELELLPEETPERYASTATEPRG